MDGGVAQNDFILQYIADLTGEKYLSHDAWCIVISCIYLQLLREILSIGFSEKGNILMRMI